MSVSTLKKKINKKFQVKEKEQKKKKDIQQRHSKCSFQKKKIVVYIFKMEYIFSLFMSHSLTLFLLFILRKFIFFRTPLARSTRCLMLFAKDDEKERKKSIKLYVCITTIIRNIYMA